MERLAVNEGDQVKPGDTIAVLDAQELTAGDDQSEIRTGFDERGELWCCLDHLLEVVQQK